MALVLAIENLELVRNEDRHGKFMINLIAALVAKGWTVRGSGDGLAAFQNLEQTGGPYDVFTASPKYITTGGTWAAGIGGANSISNPRAWVRLKEPAPSTREFIFQRASGTSTFYEMYWTIGIAYAGYLASGASANTPPTSAGTTQFLLGTAFNGLGVLWGLLDTHNTLSGRNTLIANVLISDSVCAGDVWPFYCFWYEREDSVPVLGFMYASLIEEVTGDPDPLIALAGNFTAVFGTPALIPSMAFIGRRDDGTVLTNLRLLYWKTAAVTVPTTLVGPDINGEIHPLPVYVHSALAADGRYKGRLEHFEYNLEMKNYPHVFGKDSLNPKLYLGTLMVDWITGVTPGT